MERLRDAVSLIGADRAAVLWIDEYGPALVHVHCALDLLNDLPRAEYANTPLRAAWEAGIPGIVDNPNLMRPGLSVPLDGPKSQVVVALGSDGARAWFLVVDSVAARRGLSEQCRGELMFLAGECASIVLHRDAARAPGRADSTEDASTNRFAGWAVLRDIEGHEDDQAMNRRIASRFLVARAVRSFVDDDFAVASDSLKYQIEGVRQELESIPAGDPELEAWERLLAALERGELVELAAATLELANRVERQDHLSGALELYRTAYRVAVGAGAVAVAIDAARFQGRVHRRLADWDESTRWYGFAREVARSAGETSREALCVDGMASTYRDRGNLPGARELHLEGLALSRTAQDRFAEGTLHHSLAAVEKLLGHMDQAILHGWQAVQLLDSEEARLGALTDLAGIFLEAGELRAAEDAYAIVVGSSDRYIYRTYALDAMAYVAALRGDAREFERRAARSDASGWQDAAPAIRCEFSLYRGKAYRALGDAENARRWYRQARDLADRHGLNKFYFDAEAGLDSLEVAPPTLRSVDEAVPQVMLGIREELTAMREALSVAV